MYQTITIYTYGYFFLILHFVLVTGQMNDLIIKDRQSNDELQAAVEKILDLQRKLDEKLKLESEIEELKGTKELHFIHIVHSFLSFTLC